MNILKDLATKFQLHEESMKSFIHSAPYRYKFHEIHKRHGGTREIAQPVKSLKIVQRWIIRNYLSQLPIHPIVAVAYVKNKNIKDFAEPHKNNCFLLKLDFKNFFNSIKLSDFNEYCKENNISEENARNLGMLLFCKNKENNEYYLSIGAPSSPVLSNILMAKFDNLVFDFCKQNGIIYTRYADDLAFSTNEPNTLKEKLVPYINDLCQNLNYPKHLTINADKTIFTSKKHNRTLTGLVISNDGNISIGRDKKRKLRAMAHKVKLKQLPPEQMGTLIGKIAFLKSIDPDFANQLEEKYLNNSES